MKKIVLRLFIGFLIVTALATLVFVIFFAPTRFSGPDMWPSIGDGSWLVLSRYAKVERGDVVLLRGPGGSLFIRRIAAIPGDKVGYADGHVVVEGHPATYDTVRELKIEGRAFRIARATMDGKHHEVLDDVALAPRDVPPAPINGYWVVGDNEHASDSRELGVIPPDHIKGVVVAVVTQGRRP
jgi:signal peptidase I